MGGCAAARVTRVVSPVRFDFTGESIARIDSRKNLESYYLFWLDRTVRAPEHIETKNELRTIINYIKVFDTSLECQNEIQKVNNGTIFLLADQTLGLELLARVHDHVPLNSVYLYETNKPANRDELEYTKIRGIYDSFAMAKRYLEDDVKLHGDFDDAMVIDIPDDSETTNNNNNKKEYREKFHIFLQTVRINATDIYDVKTRQHLINICLDYYQDNEKETDFIEDFNRHYQSHEALTWYMRGSCLHRLLCRAFLEHDLSILVDMYSFIVDIDRCIEKQAKEAGATTATTTATTTSSNKTNFYRGQFLSPELYESFKRNCGHVLTMQCFLMAETSREETAERLKNMPLSNKNFKRVLFEMEATNNYTVIKGSDGSPSQMVLFRLGATFRIDHVTETTVKLSQYTPINHSANDLRSESSIVIRGLLTYLKHGTLSGIAYFRQILHTIPDNDHALRSACIGQMAYLQHKKGDQASAGKLYDESLRHGAMQFQSYLMYLDRAAEHQGEVLNNWSKAKTLWQQKLLIQENFASSAEKMRTYESLVRASMALKEYEKAMEYTTAAMQGLPHDDPHRLHLQAQYDLAKRSIVTSSVK